MSQKIIAKIFNYAAGEGADNLVIAKRAGQLILDCFFPEQERQSLVLPGRLEKELFSSLRKILAVSPGEFIAHKYCELAHKSGRLNFYLTILPEANGEKIIINLVRKPFTLWRLNRLGLQTAELRELKKSLSFKSGLVLITSPDGGGKGATLNSLLLELGESPKSVYSLQKKNAYQIPGVISLPPTKTNWDKLLKLDSEIIFTDDLDNSHSLEYALRAAASGRLIFGTMTADNSWQALQQLLQSELPLKLKLDSLKIIVNQSLAPLNRKPKKDSPDGRREIGLFEILRLTPNLKKFLMEKYGVKKNEKELNYQKELEKIAAADGFRPLAYDRSKKTKEGLL
jgi:hypothetical protein